MKDINGYKIEYDFSHFKKMADLIYFDGPFLSHYVSPHGDDYLFYWVDSDELNNRWLVLRVSLPNLQQYIGHQIPLERLISSPNDGYLYLVDIDNELNYHNVQLVQPQDLPEDYMPSGQAYYEFEPIPVADAPKLMTYELTIPYQERGKLEQLLSHIGFPFSALKKMVGSAAAF